jgi:CDGSH-type Zn-finger protein
MDSYNSKNLPQAHHVIEFAGENQQKIVRICRCYQSNKFPYCDNSHKLLLEKGENVGPYVARLEPHFPQSATSPSGQAETVNIKGKVFTKSSRLLVIPFLAFAGVYAFSKIGSMERPVRDLGSSASPRVSDRLNTIS